MDIVEEMRGFEIDHEPDGWPAIRMRQVSALCDEITALRAEVERLKTENHAMSNALGYIVIRRADGTIVISCGQDAFDAAKRWLDYRAVTEGGRMVSLPHEDDYDQMVREPRQAQPVAWAVFSDNGNIRIWSKVPEPITKLAADNGVRLSPLYTEAQLQAAVAAAKREEHDACIEDVRATGGQFAIECEQYISARWKNAEGGEEG